MKLIPAIDLHLGQCVRLQQGDFNQATIYPASPQSLVRDYVKRGAKHLHIVDLDGAKAGQMKQPPLIETLLNTECSLQVGGGIRDIATVRNCLEAGIKQLVIGSIAINNPQLTQQIINLAGADRIVLAIDVKFLEGIPRPAIHGWQTQTTSNLWDIVADYQQLGIQHILCTDIQCDGMLQGPNFDLYQQALSRFPDMFWQASGGIRHQDDLKELSKIGLSAAILGKMLYQAKEPLSFKEAISC